MTVTQYGIRNCDTVKKARAWLNNRKIKYAFHDYKTAGIDTECLRFRCKELGWETLLNRVVYDISGKPPATIEWE